MAYTDPKKIDQILFLLSKHISGLVQSPINEKVEKEKFFDSSSYNPLFKYSPPNPKLDHYMEILNDMQADSNTVIGTLLNEKIIEFKKMIRLMQSTGKDSFTRNSLYLYGKPSDKLIDIAQKLKFSIDHDVGYKVNTGQMKIQLRRALDKFGFDWQIKTKDMPAWACVTHKEKALILKKDYSFPQNTIKRLIVHEIGTHILRAENGAKQPYKIFTLGLNGYLKTEEGLAVLNEELNHCLCAKTIKSYAGRVIAVSKALKLSFRDTYDYLEPTFGKEQAWNLTLRAKRGTSNTNWAGAFTKDYLYLRGYLEVKNYLKVGGDLSKLYVGRIGLEHVDKTQNMPELINPLFLPGSKYLASITDKVGDIIEIIR